MLSNKKNFLPWKIFLSLSTKSELRGGGSVILGLASSLGISASGFPSSVPLGNSPWDFPRGFPHDVTRDFPGWLRHYDVRCARTGLLYPPNVVFFVRSKCLFKLMSVWGHWFPCTHDELLISYLPYFSFSSACDETVNCWRSYRLGHVRSSERRRRAAGDRPWSSSWIGKAARAHQRDDVISAKWQTLVSENTIKTSRNQLRGNSERP